MSRQHLRIGSLAVVLAGLFAFFALSGSLSADRVQEWFDGLGAAGPFVFIAASALMTVSMFPGPLLAGASGLLFGTALGTPVSIASATLGAVLAFSLGRWWAHDAVEELATGRIARLRAWIGARGFFAVLYARLAPGVPYNVVNYAAGLSPVTLGAFSLATLVGCAPRAFAYTALGGNLDNLGSPEVIAALVVLVVMAVGGLVAIRRSGPGTARSSRDGRSAGPR
ncbi:MAG: TVP38/TMEM64 family protein [Solirubrobacteraceae bacterium]